MKTLEDTQRFLEEKAEELNLAKSMDRNEMYKILIGYGNSLDKFPEEKEIDENFVKGCTSNVYISSELREGRVYYSGKSDALIVRGYVAILIEALNGLKASDVMETEKIVQDFVEATDVKASLTPSRANAFGNIYKMMRKKAESSQ